MAGGFFMMFCLFLVSAPVVVHGDLTINPSPLAEDILRTILEKLLKLEGGIAVLATCKHQKSGGEGLGAVVAQLVADLQSTNSQLKVTQTDLQATQTELQSTQAELQTIQTELQATQTELQTIQTKLQTTQTELQTAQTELQSQLQNTYTDLNATQTELQTTQTELQTTQTELQSSKTDLQSQLQNIQTKLTNQTALLKADQGSVFVRWGRKSCPANTTLVYSGVAGGKQWNEKGSGTNRLCLTTAPQFDDTPLPESFGRLYGAEYQYIPDHQDLDVPCSLCRAPQSTTIMMAATLTCPPGWTAQYTGHLTAANVPDHATEYVCLDNRPENGGSQKDQDGLLFYYIATVCGSLPCPPYENNRIVTCVVCFK